VGYAVQARHTADSNIEPKPFDTLEPPEQSNLSEIVFLGNLNSRHPSLINHGHYADGPATYLTILYITLLLHRAIHDDLDGLAAIRTLDINCFGVIHK
jgi:hypothetical protein